MRYIVVGAGPAGLALACVLAENGHAVTVYECKSDPGGSWKASFVDGAYFTENSPRLLLGSARGFFRYLGMTDSDFANVYGNAVQTNIHILKHFFRNLSFGDWAAFAKAFVGGVDPDATFEDWMRSAELTERGRRALEVFCITINNVPRKTSAREVFNLISKFEMKGGRQMRDPNRWYDLCIDKILEGPHNRVVTGARVSSLVGSSDASRVAGVVVNGKNDYADRVVLCTQTPALLGILRDTPFARNWPVLTPEYIADTTYYAFGFQVHFAASAPAPAPDPARWCWSCAGPWTVIILPVGDWLVAKSLDPAVVDVWSCCVVDMDSPSPHAGGLTANEIPDEDDVLRECMRQIRQSAGPGARVEPKAVTLSPGLRHDGSRWVSGETGYTSGGRPRVPLKGKAHNLFALGCFSESDRPETAHLGTAIDAVAAFLHRYEPRSRGFHRAGPDTGALVAAVAVAVVIVYAFRAFRV